MSTVGGLKDAAEVTYKLPILAEGVQPVKDKTRNAAVVLKRVPAAGTPKAGSKSMEKSSPVGIHRISS